jgi:hypothetical protein
MSGMKVLKKKLCISHRHKLVVLIQYLFFGLRLFDTENESIVILRPVVVSIIFIARLSELD